MLHQFNALPPRQQLSYVYQNGTYLAWRDEPATSVSLYHLPGHFFAEPYYDTYRNQLVRVRSFTGAGPLADYDALVQLPEGWM